MENIYLAGPGYVWLPAGFKAYRTERLVDAWWGYILSPGGDFKIDISSGMVGSPFGIDEDKFVWTRIEGKSKGAIKIGLKRADKGEVVVASGIWINFTAPVKHAGDVDLFLAIVRSYRDEECHGCEEIVPATPSNNGMQRSADTRVFIFMQRLFAPADARRSAASI